MIPLALITALITATAAAIGIVSLRLVRNARTQRDRALIEASNARAERMSAVEALDLMVGQNLQRRKDARLARRSKAA